MADLQVINGKVVYLDENGNILYSLPTQVGTPGQSVIFDEDGNLAAGLGLSTLGSLSNVDSTADSPAAGKVLSFNGVYWEATDLSIGGVVFDSAYVQARQDFSYTSLINTPNILDSSNVEAIIDADYVNSLGVVGTDSNAVADIIAQVVNNLYVQNRQDYAYSSLTGVPTAVSAFSNDAGYLTSATVTSVIDQSYVTGLIDATYLDEDEVVALVDSDYVQGRQDYSYESLIDLPDFFDSNDATVLVDSNYVQARQDYQYSSLVDLPDFFDSNDATVLVDSNYVQARQDYSYGSLIDLPDLFDSNDATVLVDSNYVQARQDYSYGSLIDLPDLFDSADATVLIDSDYVQARQDYSYGSLIDLPDLFDSADATILVDSDYVQTRQDYSYGSLIDLPDLFDSADATILVDSDYVQTRQDDHNLTSDASNTTVAANFIPDADDTRTLGSSSNRFSTIFGAMPVYDSIGLLPNQGLPGEMAFVPSASRLYVSTGAGWFKLVIDNAAPSIVSVTDSNGDPGPFALSLTQLPTIISVEAIDSDLEDTLTFGYVADSEFSTFASISQNDNVFTINPFSIDSAPPAATGSITFSVTDGLNTDTSEQTFSIDFRPDWSNVSLQQRVVASDYTSLSFDRFGDKIAISGDTAVVSAWQDDDAGSNTGAVYIFTRSESTWTQQQKLTPSDGQANDLFGRSVAIDGDIVVVGASNHDGEGTNSGAAYVFTRSGTTWTEQQKLVGFDTITGHFFGRGVAVSGNIIVVGAEEEDRGASFVDAGAAFVFTTSDGGSTWNQKQKLKASDQQADGGFGIAVAIDGDTLVVGATGHDNAAGALYVFTTSDGGTNWTEQQKLSASDPSGLDILGQSVAIDGDDIIAGAPGEDDPGFSSGAAYVFTRSGTTWTQQQKIESSDIEDGDYLGSDVDIFNQVLIVSARHEDTGGVDAGAAYIFTRTAGVWTQQSKVQATIPTAGDDFGEGVALGVDVALVGASGDTVGSTSNAGAVYVYQASFDSA